MTFEELHAKAKEERERPPWKHRLSIMSYEQASRRSAVAEEGLGYPFPGVLLPQEDWLILELDRLLRLREALEDLRERSRSKRESVILLLGVLVVYLAAVAFVATFG